MGNRTKLINEQIENRLGEERYNYQGCLMKIIEYNKYSDIVVQFQDKYKANINTEYKEFLSGRIKNPYYPSVFGVGMIGLKYPSRFNGQNMKEYNTWIHMLERCFDKKGKEKYPTYTDVTCCNEWLLFENFYEWLHEQENFNKWLNGSLWAIDKDILVKGNKVYSPNTCCLVPQNVNGLFTKRDNYRGNLPIGVSIHGSGFRAVCTNPFTKKRENLGTHSTPQKAFLSYKKYKEDLIKQVAQLEYDKNNITEQCYNAMLNYKVEITD